MPVSPEIQMLIAAGLEEVRQSPKFVLSGKSQYTLYRSLCPEIGRLALKLPYSRFEFFERLRVSKEPDVPAGFHQYAWLMVLTARHAQVAVERFVASVPSTPETARLLGLTALPLRMLDIAEQVIQNTIDVEEASDLLCNDFYVEMSSVAHAFTYPVSCAIRAAYEALEMILYPSPDWRSSRGGLAWLTVEAHTAIDENERGAWIRSYCPIDRILPENYSYYNLGEDTIADRKTGYPSIYQPPLPIRYDLANRLRQWEWWLTEAIPEAWARGET